MDHPPVRVRPAADGGFDVVCRDCELGSRLHPDEPFSPQIRLFLDQHRHEEDGQPEDAASPVPPR